MVTTSQDLHDTLDTLLTASVVSATGNPQARPRPGQSALAHDILAAMIGSPGGQAEWSREQVAGQAPTGVGKSLAALAPAMLMAVERGERSVVSTESLTLQAQYVDKDAPTVAAACEDVLGASPSVAVLKGWGNYVCMAKAATTAAKVTGVDAERVTPSQVDHLRTTAGTKLSRVAAKKRSTVTLDAGDVPAATLAPVLDWALAQGGGTDKDGDRHSYPGDGDHRAWEAVSTTPDGCVGAGACPFADQCLPEKARARAAEADMVVTNHAMLAVQAATNAPVILGSKRLGTFRHLVVDEAHGLPGTVRSQGARAVTAARVEAISRAVDKVVAPAPGESVAPQVKAMTDSAAVIADRLDVQLERALAAGKPRAGVAKVDPGADPLAGVGDDLARMLVQARKLLPPRDLQVGRYPISTVQRVRRAHAAIDALSDDVTRCRTHDAGHARWLEEARGGRKGRFTGAALKTSPVDVSSLLRSSVWTTNALDTGSAAGDNEANSDRGDSVWSVPAHEWSTPDDPVTKSPPRYEMSATCMSATLGASFVFDAGLSVKPTAYPSPFDDAYGSSMLFVPRATNSDLPRLTSDRYGKPRFDTALHPQWAGHILRRLVDANDGSALVLSATVSAGKHYAQMLREGTGHTVHTQWDGPPVRSIIAEWAEDVGSVMVGTRSLMTGVDAAGPTCTLVVIDRVPRSAGNPVDDARVEAVTERTGMDRWSADRLVYVADAALLLEQAAGRLIRSSSDRGMVACLDPRLLKSAPKQVSYPAASREALLGAFSRFPAKSADLAAAEAFLSSGRVGQAA